MELSKPLKHECICDFWSQWRRNTMRQEESWISCSAGSVISFLGQSASMILRLECWHRWVEQCSQFSGFTPFNTHQELFYPQLQYSNLESFIRCLSGSMKARSEERDHKSVRVFVFGICIETLSSKQQMEEETYREGVKEQEWSSMLEKDREQRWERRSSSKMGARWWQSERMMERKTCQQLASLRRAQ